MLMFKIKNEIAPQWLLDIFVYTKDTHEIASRSSNNNTFQVPEPNYEFYNISIKYQRPVLWNSLHPLLQSVKNIEEFKRLYKKRYLNDINGVLCFYYSYMFK